MEKFWVVPKDTLRVTVTRFVPMATTSLMILARVPKRRVSLRIVVTLVAIRTPLVTVIRFRVSPRAFLTFIILLLACVAYPSIQKRRMAQGVSLSSMFTTSLKSADLRLRNTG